MTPGNAFMASSARANNAARAGIGSKASPVANTRSESNGRSSKPRLARWSERKLRIIKCAPTRSARDSATCPMASPCWTRCDDRPSEAVRPPCDRGPVPRGRDTLIAGSRPTASVVNIVSPTVNATIRTSGSSRSQYGNSAGQAEGMTRMHHNAPERPTAVPAAATIALSAST